MFRSIRDFLSQIKPRTEAFLVSTTGADVALFLVILLVGFGAFGLGRLSVGEGEQGGITLGEAPTSTAPIPLPPGGQIVASWTGNVYYYPWCGGAKNISQGNLRWFSSEEKAKAAGYKPAANCKGL